MTTRKQLAELKQNKLQKKIKNNISSEEKIRIVLEGIQGSSGVDELCQKEGIPVSVYTKWVNEFIEAGKRKLKGEPVNESSSSRIQELEKENLALKLIVAELTLEVRKLKDQKDSH